MKSKSDIEKRLRSLRVKHAKRYVSESQSRCHENCLYNRLHVPTGIYSSSKSIDVSMASKKQNTLVVIQPEAPIRLCMYGSENPNTWSGTICDNDSISKSCNLFVPAVSADAAREDFLQILSDDEYVFENYKDIAALQWVLNDRVAKMSLSIWERFILWLSAVFLRTKKPISRLSSGSIPDDLWGEDDNSQSDP